MAERVGVRAMCIWLGTLATWRPGLVRQLLREHGGTAEILRRPPQEIAAFMAVRSSRTASAGSIGERQGSGERRSDAERFAAALSEGPRICARRAERRPPGDIVVAWNDALYPDQLRDLPDPPFCLFVRGGAHVATTRARLSEIVDRPVVAVVGTRGPLRPTARRWRGPLLGI